MPNFFDPTAQLSKKRIRNSTKNQEHPTKSVTLTISDTERQINSIPLAFRVPVFDGVFSKMQRRFPVHMQVIKDVAEDKRQAESQSRFNKLPVRTQKQMYQALTTIPALAHLKLASGQLRLGQEARPLLQPAVVRGVGHHPTTLVNGVAVCCVIACEGVLTRLRRGARR